MRLRKRSDENIYNSETTCMNITPIHEVCLAGIVALSLVLPLMATGRSTTRAPGSKLVPGRVGRAGLVRARRTASDLLTPKPNLRPRDRRDQHHRLRLPPSSIIAAKPATASPMIELRTRELLRRLETYPTHGDHAVNLCSAGVSMRPVCEWRTGALTRRVAREDTRPPRRRPKGRGAQAEARRSKRRSRPCA